MGAGEPPELEGAQEEVSLPRYQSQTGTHFTPQKYLTGPRRLFGGTIPLDPATAPWNPTRARRFYTAETNGLERDWARHDGVFINPPYGKAFGFHAFLRKIHLEAERGVPIVALMPIGTRYSTGYWQEDVLTEFLNATTYVKGRIHFEDANGVAQKNNNHDSAYYGFNVDKDEWARCFWHYGRTFATELL